MPRGSEVQIYHKTSKKGFKNIQKLIATLSHLSGRRYAVANLTARDIPNLGPFWVVKIQVCVCAWAMPPLPPDKNIPVIPCLYIKFSSGDFSHNPTYPCSVCVCVCGCVCVSNHIIILSAPPWIRHWGQLT